MTALELLSFVNQVLFVGLFVIVLWRALRARTRASFDTALLFGSVAALVILSHALEWAGLEGTPGVSGIVALLLNTAPYAMIRLVDDFSGTPRWVKWAGTLAYLVIAAAVIAFERQTSLIELVTLAWFMTVGGYAAFAFARQIGRTSGITRNRMAAVATGAILFIVAIVLALVGALAQEASPWVGIVTQVAALAAVLAFFGGFAPPAWIRRAWREPDLRRFLDRSIHLVAMTDERAAIIELQQAVAATFGATGASVGLVDAEGRMMRYPTRAGGWLEVPADDFIAGRAYRSQRRVVVADAAAADPEHADVYRANGATAVIATPLNVEDKHIGALAVFADRAPIFVEDDLWLIELMAGHTAVLLETRALAAEASALHAREEAARLKEEFLSAAAHDLRTPLTVVLGQAELLERRLTRDPGATVDLAGISRIASEARRLRDLITELLDTQRLEHRGVMERETMDLRDVVSAVRDRQLEYGRALAVVQPAEPILSTIDRTRIEQVVENLIDNALKYAAQSPLPDVRLWAEGSEARLSVIDRGIGIPEAERDRIFERFYRATNAQSITETGMGLGLYICRRIIEEHAGRIWVEPTPGGGSTFTIALPLSSVAPEAVVESTQATWSGASATEAVADA
jgi:signal transduction histidine kinase